MKTAQKLEFGCGIAVLFIAFLQLLLFVFFESNHSENRLAVNTLATIFLLFPAFAVFIGSYIHTVKQDNSGFAIILFFCSILLCFYGYFFIFSFGFTILINLVTEPEKTLFYFTQIIMWILPGFFVACTLILAITNLVKQVANENNFHKS
jgi:glucan phosphoethanolaminetransferase (alkaline phosphatase superfamily)